MKTAQYLDECKKTLELSSDYKLAKLWEIDDGSMSRYRSGSLKPDNYLCFRIAETLQKSPSLVIAELEIQNAKNEVKSLYFKRFFSTVGLWIILGFGLSAYNPKLANADDISSTAGSRANTTYTPIIRNRKPRKKPTQLCQIVDIIVRYFTCNWHVKFL